jgi:AraC-like DNA-binding protein
LISEGNIDMIAVIFHPLGLNPFVRCSMSELYNHYIDVEDLEDIELNHLKRNISAEPAVETCIRLIERFFMQRLVDANCNYQRTHHAIRQIINQPQIDVNTLAESACLGYRQFKRVFSNYVGMSPKEYYRVVRFQRALYLLQNHPGMEFVDLAYSCGFYDPSHLVKDFKEFTGCSPTQYLSSRSPYSTFFSEDCRLNVIKSPARKLIVSIDKEKRHESIGKAKRLIPIKRIAPERKSFRLPYNSAPRFFGQSLLAIRC